MKALLWGVRSLHVLVLTQPHYNGVAILRTNTPCALSLCSGFQRHKLFPDV